MTPGEATPSHAVPRRRIADAPAVSLRGKGSVFQRLDEAAELYRDHLGVDLPALVGPTRWNRLLRFAAIRHVLVHNAGIADAKFLTSYPDWPRPVGQRIHVTKDDADGILEVLMRLAEAVARVTAAAAAAFAAAASGLALPSWRALPRRPLPTVRSASS